MLWFFLFLYFSFCSDFCLGLVPFVGKESSTHVFEVFDSTPLAEKKGSTQEAFNTAMACMAKKEFREAVNGFEEVLKRDCDDFAAQRRKTACTNDTAVDVLLEK